MSRVFRLGDFFGITAAEVVLFKPSKFEQLLKCKYTAQINESIYSLCKEFEFLKKSMETDAMKPNYDKLVEDFKMFGYLNLTPDSSVGRSKVTIAKFYQDYCNKSIEELRSTYGSDTDEIINVVKESLTIDVGATFKNISKEGVAIVNAIYNNYQYLVDMYNKCKEAYNNSHTTELVIAGRNIRDILELDKNNSTTDIRCCSFTNHLLAKLRMSVNNTEVAYALKELEHDITNIQNEYNAKDIVFTSVSEIMSILEDVYDDMTIDKFRDITGLTDATVESLDKTFKELDNFKIGGLGLNSRDIGKDIVKSISNEDTSGWSIKARERNEKLDDVLRIAYIDLKSRQYMMNI